jgi:predicted permease
MVAVFLQTLPFFALILLGFGAGKSGFFSQEATAALTRFVFFFPLSALLFRFAAGLSIEDILDWHLIGAYLAASVTVYLLASGVALLRGRGMQEAAVEAQCAIIGNLGFLGIPLLPLLLGEAAIGPLFVVIAVDLIVFSSLIVILITGARDGRMSPAVLATVCGGLVRNPMVVSILAGLAWSALDLPMPAPVWEFLTILGAAATPGALFAIGASLAGKSAERMSVAAWLTFCKLAVHPAVVAVSVLVLFPVAAFPAAVAVAAASLPVAGNVYMLAQHYGVAPQRVSASILLSTILSIVTIPAVIGWLGTG